MRYRELGRPGRPGLRVSEIGLESREIGGTVWIDGPSGSSRPYGYGVADDDESLRMISRAHALGINFILTSPTFGIGHAERLIGQAINGDRDYWVLGLMGGLAIDGTRLVRDISYESLTANLQASLGRLGTSDADLFLIESVTEAELRDGSCIDSLKRIGVPVPRDSSASMLTSPPSMSSCCSDSMWTLSAFGTTCSNRWRAIFLHARNRLDWE